MHPRSPIPQRHAITLIEVLLVLTLLVMMAAMAWPAMDRPMADQRLRKAADKLQAAWSRARIDAISTGQTYLFRCTLESDEYTIQAQAGPESVAAISSSNEGEFDESESPSTEPLASKTGRLPEDVTFVDGSVVFDTRATIFTEVTEELDRESSGTCLEPILFFPDGTTSTATLILENKYQRRIELSLRGLTGVVTVGDTYSADDSLHAADGSLESGEESLGVRRND